MYMYVYIDTGTCIVGNLSTCTWLYMYNSKYLHEQQFYQMNTYNGHVIVQYCEEHTLDFQ